MNLEDFQGRFEALNQVILEAVQTVENDGAVDLAAFDRDVQDLCAEVAAAGPEIAGAVKPMIADLIANLDALAGALSAYTERKRAQHEGDIS